MRSTNKEEKKIESKIYVTPPEPPKYRDLLAYVSEDELKSFMNLIRQPNLNLDTVVDLYKRTVTRENK